MKRFLITPLNWGLGHATRCIPVIHGLLQKNAEVMIASDGNALQFLKKEFPDLKFFELPGYNITYPSGGSMVLKMMAQLPMLLKAVNAEHAAISKIVAAEKPDVIISDNRYGCYNKACINVFITHQLNIQTPPHLSWAQPIIRQINLNRISKFDECWIPDFQGAINLSGELSHSTIMPQKTFFIGPLSDFFERAKSDEQSSIVNLQSSILILISGPEPQRSIFEALVLGQAKSLTTKTNIVCGRAGDYRQNQLTEFVTVHSALNSKAVFELMTEADLVISRSGYTTLMDLAATGKKAALVPTAGQTEQEYLAKKFFDAGIYFTQKQSEFDLQKAILSVENFSGIKLENDFGELKSRIELLMK